MTKEEAKEYLEYFAREDCNPCTPIRKDVLRIAIEAIEYTEVMNIILRNEDKTICG